MLSQHNEMIMCFFVSVFVYIMDYTYEILYIEPSLHPWNEAYLIMMDDCFDVFLDSLGKNFIEYFASISIREIGLKFSFFVGSLYVFFFVCFLFFFAFFAVVV